MGRGGVVRGVSLTEREIRAHPPLMGSRNMVGVGARSAWVAAAEEQPGGESAAEPSERAAAGVATRPMKRAIALRPSIWTREGGRARVVVG